MISPRHQFRVAPLRGARGHRCRGYSSPAITLLVGVAT